MMVCSIGLWHVSLNGLVLDQTVVWGNEKLLPGGLFCGTERFQIKKKYVIEIAMGNCNELSEHAFEIANLFA